MANYEFKLPDIGEGVAEGEIVGWLVKQGDWVNEGQDMVEVMTDKATVTIGAPKPGRIAQVNGAVGDTVPVGSVLVIIDLDGTEPASRVESTPSAQPAPAKPEVAAPTPKSPPSDEGQVASAVGDIKANLPGMGLDAQSPKTELKYFTDRPLAAPATRKLARELGVDLRRVEPSGKDGRIVRDDVERAGSRSAEPAAAPAPAPSSPAPVALRTAAGTDERIPVRGLRKRIFENMARSKHTAAHFTYVDECDVSALMELRERLSPAAQEEGVTLTYLPFIVKAVAHALKKHPRLNAHVDDAAQEIIVRAGHDIGIAMATDAGLIVPVVRNVDQLSILDIAREIRRLGDAARVGKTAVADLGGSTFTITSLGKLGGLFATPVINYPEVAILGIHEIKRRPVVRGDEIVIGQVMLLSLSFDHRVIDGDVGAGFAKEIIRILEEPYRLILSG
jgi:pyruvate dehydrogenase E2 component (dihydrolipoamide acetyltransferase)